MALAALGVVTMANTAYWISGPIFAGSVVSSLFGLGACVQFLRDSKQQEK